MGPIYEWQRLAVVGNVQIDGIMCQERRGGASATERVYTTTHGCFWGGRGVGWRRETRQIKMAATGGTIRDIITVLSNKRQSLRL